VIFFNNEIREGCRFNKVVADVNCSYGQNVVIGAEVGSEAQKVTVMGWNNHVPRQIRIEEGATVYPGITPSRWPAVVSCGEVLR